jgi:hypothetical protein
MFTKIPTLLGTQIPRIANIRTAECLVGEMGERLVVMGLAPLGQFAGELVELVTSATS